MTTIDTHATVTDDVPDIASESRPEVAGQPGHQIVDVAIIGSGFSGLAMVHRLLEQGIRDVIVLERADEVGGTWRDNTYPGAACDVPSHLYSLSFAPNPDWTHSFSRQTQIQEYLRGVADRFDLRRHIRFNAEVLSARWDEEALLWRVETTSGALSCRFLVSGAGALSDPVIPEVVGLETFEGEVFHSARWRHDLDLSGRRVAVVGTGASAIQFIPEIQPLVDRLVVLQRTPPWILPRPDRSSTRLERHLYRRFPAMQRAVRAALYLGRESTVVTFLDPRYSRLSTRLAQAHLNRAVRDPRLRRRLTPDYTIGCKRILLSNSYYPALRQPNVDVIGGLASVGPDTVTDADGVTHEVDTIIFGTGFSVQEPRIAARIVGIGGEPLARQAMRPAGSLLGTSFSGFPNLFLLLGPNTGLGHNSQVFMIERQVEYVARILSSARLSAIARIEARPEAQAAWTVDVDERMSATVWSTGGCSSWYLDESGRNSTLWPGSTLSFRRLTRSAGLGDYHVSRAGPVRPRVRGGQFSS